MKKLLAGLLLTITLASPILAAAQITGVQTLPDKTVLGDTTNDNTIAATVKPDNVIGVINTIINWFFTILIVLAVAFIVYAGYKYLFSGGSEEAVSTAHKMLIYAMIAVAVGTLAKGIVFIIRSFVLGGSTTSQTAKKTDTPVANAGVCSDVGVGFAKVPHPSLTNLAVSTCGVNNWATPAVQIDGTMFGNLSNITDESGKQGLLVPYSMSGHTIMVQQCSNGLRPVLCSDKTEIRPLDGLNFKAPGGSETVSGPQITPQDQAIADRYKAERAAAQQGDYKLNAMPEVLVPYCSDGSVVGVTFRGTRYDPPANLSARTTQSRRYGLATNTAASEDASADLCPDGTSPQPLWLGAMKYWPQ